MSTSVHQIIEVNVGGKWVYVPLADEITDDTSTIDHCGSIRDLFVCKWYGAEDYINNGIPDDISKAAREAMIYKDEDFVDRGSCWISWQQYEALSESLRKKTIDTMDKIARVRSESGLSKRLDKIENALTIHIFGRSKDDIEKDMGTDRDENDWMDDDYYREELEDHMWAWCCAERNMAEIEAYIDRFFNQAYPYPDFPGMASGVRIIMYVS